MNQSYLNDYFRNVWGNLELSNPLNQILSGKDLIDKIKHENVIDIGCGKNVFKQFVPNLIGIDPAFSEADYQMTLEQFSIVNKELYDVALCLGSINFGDIQYIESQIKLVCDMLKPKAKIYWRCNPGRKDHGNVNCESIDFYPWSFDDHIFLSEKFGFKLAELRWDNNNRIYSEWYRNEKEI